MENLKLQTFDTLAGNRDKIAALFPHCLTERLNKDGELERVIDFDMLKQELSGYVVEGSEERYQFTWPEKKKSILLANTPVSKTLRPCREESVNFDTTENLYIEGDNLDVLKILQETYLNKVKMIYIDPPYNTGKDFVYSDNFTMDKEDWDEESGNYDEDGNRLVQNLESNGRFHTDWLNMIYPRLKVAKDLLTDDGVIFISIDDNEVHNLRKICDEIFGAGNFIGCFIVNSTPNARDYGHIGKMHEFVICYAKSILKTSTNLLPEAEKKFKYSDSIGGYNIHPLYNSNEAFSSSNRPNLYYPFYIYLNEPLENNFFKIGLKKQENSVEIYPPKSLKNNIQFVWRWGKIKAEMNLDKEITGYRTSDGEFRIVQKMRSNEKLIRSLLLDTQFSSRRGTAEVEEIFQAKIFSFPKPLALISCFAFIGLDHDSIIIDLFSGSATTAHAVMQLNAEDGGNRKFICVQLPEETDEKSEAFKAGYKNICEIGKERIRRAGKKILDEYVKNHPVDSVATPPKEGNLKASQSQQFLMTSQEGNVKTITGQQSLMTSQEENVKGCTNPHLDIGFRVLKVDSSNTKDDIYARPVKLTQGDLLQQEDNIKEARTPEDLLFQAMLQLGVLPSHRIEETSIAGKKVFTVNYPALIACFDENVTEEVITEIAKQKPYYFVTRDSSMATDSVAVNFDNIFKLYSDETKRLVL